MYIDTRVFVHTTIQAHKRSISLKTFIIKLALDQIWLEDCHFPTYSANKYIMNKILLDTLSNKTYQNIFQSRR